jgi:hypothetical protein
MSLKAMLARMNSSTSRRDGTAAACVSIRLSIDLKRFYMYVMESNISLVAVVLSATIFILCSDTTLRAFLSYKRIRIAVHWSKCLCNKKREDKSGVGVHFHWISCGGNLAPAHSLVWAGATVAAVVLGAGVYVDCVLCAIAHEIGIAGVVLCNTPPKDYHASGSGRFGVHGEVVELTHILHDVEDEARVLV